MNELETIIGGRAGRVHSIGFGFRSARAYCARLHQRGHFGGTVLEDFGGR